MQLKEIAALWSKISKVIADEISTNAEFAQKINNVWDGEDVADKPKRKNRCSPAKIDPFVFLEQGEDKLLEELGKLSVDELKDVISANGMDTAKLAMKWKDRDRLEKHILDATKRKSSRGEAFWKVQGQSDNDLNN
jgi:hypothetical protein